ncbi:stage III sporulation protein AD [Ornithinibacillus halophilus]|uniref:Stage III sporulation protein AD n=1 Tax=Ornithinibacillus halophilus TaxID=930117 RepID=A0A1M5CYU4_9BACI|nr:stage III sporulation protein AD [Ornithinibacillus halophilus]SHF59899.1 stage III sporulation protein AD [Ornithinibacillus halophilus]
MDIIQIVIIGIIASILYIILKDLKGPFAFLIVLITGITIFIVVINQIGSIIQMIESLGQKASIDGMYIDTILKIIGIAYITELGANITKDAGLGAVASKIELAGKIFILLLALPIITAVIETIFNFLPST